MSASRSYPVRVMTMGVIVLLLVSLGLYWGRFVCKIALGNVTPYANRRVRVEPCALAPVTETEPNAASPSRISADVNPTRVPWLGVADYFSTHLPLGANSGVFQHLRGEETLCTYFDPQSGKIVQYKIYQEDEKEQEQGSLWVKESLLFVGPEGISVVDSADTGRFVAPLVAFDVFSNASLVIYDTELQRFFRGDLEARRITPAPAESSAEMGRIVAIGQLQKNAELLDLGWTPPLRPATDQERQSRARDLVTGNLLPLARLSRDPGEFILVLDDSGCIYKLERETLAFAGVAGYLPTAPEYGISEDDIARPRDLLAYHVAAAAFDPDNTHRGLYVATLSRDGTGATLAVFDADGEMIRRDVTMAASVRRRMEQSEADVPGSGLLDADIIARARTHKTFFEMAWGPALVGITYLLENLQPPVFSVASYFTAASIGAEAGNRNLLLLPDSFAGMLGRKHQQRRIQRMAILMLMISPSLVLAGLLAMAVKGDATAIGLSDRAVKYWTAGTLAFGLCAYLTWRLNRPGEKLVTCVNCGRGRRPDMEKCHRCGSAWEVAELNAPSWRVFDNHAAESCGHTAMLPPHTENAADEAKEETP
ncbi:MAG: hypothetical protein IH624_06490 [Phycisphaerae bacterium]|nr:hypothetical protein [Phycisphaerae bacterium]